MTSILYYRFIEGKCLKIKKFTLRFDNEELHQEFKIKTIKQKSNMQQELIKMVEKYLKDGGEYSNKKLQNEID